MEKNNPDKWFRSLGYDEAVSALFLSRKSGGVSNKGILSICSFIDSGIRTEHYGEYPETAILRCWETLSDEDKSAVHSFYKAAEKKPLAPNGRPSNLSPENWQLVRTAKFKAWFGDWENDPTHASRCLDENGEPLLVYHGSDKDFERFELSRNGGNTGKGEWVDRRTEEKIGFDSNYGIFFSSHHDQAASYSLLAQYYRQNELKRALHNLFPCVNASVNYDFKTRGEFLSALRLAAEVSPLCGKLLSLIDGNPDKSILKELLPGMSVGEREALRDEVKTCRDVQRRICGLMDKGGLSNMYHNYTSQASVIRHLKTDLVRLAHNDMTVKNQFGTFADHSQDIMAGGNDYVQFCFDDKKRCFFIGEGVAPKRLYLDECTSSDLVKIMNAVDNAHERFGRAVRQELSENGYNDHAFIYSCFLNIRNPLAHDYEMSAFPDKYKGTSYETAYIAARQVRKALSDGNDGVVYRNIVDPFQSDTYGVFSPEQVMMIGCRRGLLNQIEPDSPGIRRSAKQWFDKLDEAGKEDLEKKTDGQKKRLTGIQEPAAKATQGRVPRHASQKTVYDSSKGKGKNNNYGKSRRYGNDRRKEGARADFAKLAEAAAGESISHKI